MAGKAKTVEMCGKTLNLGDWVIVCYESSDIAGGHRMMGYISELWSPKIDNHLQARVSKTPNDKYGWCFHDKDCIEEHTPQASCLPNKKGE